MFLAFPVILLVLKNQIWNGCFPALPVQVYQVWLQLSFLPPGDECAQTLLLKLLYIPQLLLGIFQLNGPYCHEFVPYDFSVVVLHPILIISFHLWCMLGGIVWIQLKSNLFWYIEGQTFFVISWHTKMSSTLNAPRWNVLCANLHTTSEHALKVYQIRKVLYSKQATFYQKPQ